MKKGCISCLIVLTMLFSLIPVHAERDIGIYVDNTQLKCDVPAFIDNGRTMVPMRNIFESLGARVSWDNETKTITAEKPDVVITLQIGSTLLTKNGESEQLDTVPTIVSDTTFVPVRAVSQALGANVVWDDESYAVYISSDLSTSDNNAEPTVLMYAPDGRTLEVPQSEVEAYKGVGWYTEPVVLMYASDGRTLYVIQSEVEAYKGVGWYTEPVVLMYSADGRTTYAPKSEVETYKGVGWYTEPYKPAKSSTSSGKSSSSSSGGSTHVGSTVYVTPSGKRYHYLSSCAGKNARATTLSSAKASGYTPCSKCAK